MKLLTNSQSNYWSRNWLRISVPTEDVFHVSDAVSGQQLHVSPYWVALSDNFRVANM